MKDKLMKVKNKVKLAFLNAAVAIGSVGTGLYVGMTQAYANDIKSYTINTDNLSFSQLQGRLLGLLILIFRLVGVVLLITGISKSLLAVKDERPEDVKGGITTAIIGGVLAIIVSVLKLMGIELT